MNVVYISPNFPTNYYRFCEELRRNGVSVLGIGDCPYEQLTPELKAALTEYYKVGSLEDYDELIRAVGYFTFRYGKIDWLESNNEYWLETDAALRTDFNINSGLKTPDMPKIKYKSKMKEYYAKAGIPTARYHLVDTLENGLAFASEVGYPVIVKPDNGVGANSTFKLKNEDQLREFYASGWSTQYIMEEFVNGEICSYDSIIDSNGTPLLETGNITPISIMDSVNDRETVFFYIVPNLKEDVRAAGRACVKAFGVRSRCTHLEFFRLLEDKPGLGKKGDIVGLEVNMRPSGGFTPEMINYANSTDFYKDWADMVCFDKLTKESYPEKFYGVHVGRRNEKHYRHSHRDVMSRYRGQIMETGVLDPALATGMGDRFYIARIDTAEQLEQFRKYVSEEV